MRRSTAFLWVVASCAIAGFSAAHGPKSKPFWNGKHNAVTRGAAGAAATELIMMQPPLQVTGRHDLVGFDVTLQDEDPLTLERLTISAVRFAANGVDPDLSPAGLLTSRSFFAFGFPPPGGGNAFQFTMTIGLPVRMPDHFGVVVSLPAASGWPQSDGLSVQAQLNLPNDPLRPRVPAARAGAVWAFERPAGTSAAVPLGGRTLDTLAVSPLFAGSVLQGFVRSSAYGNPPEDLYGPESLFPEAARGDEFGLSVHAASATFPFALVYLSPTQLPTPFCCIGAPNDHWYLGLAPPFPLQLGAIVLDPNGFGTVGPFPMRAIPPALRSFWVQAAVVSQAMQVQLTDAVGFAGL